MKRSWKHARFVYACIIACYLFYAFGLFAVGAGMVTISNVARRWTGILFYVCMAQYWLILFVEYFQRNSIEDIFGIMLERHGTLEVDSRQEQRYMNFQKSLNQDNFWWQPSRTCWYKMALLVVLFATNIVCSTTFGSSVPKT
eukprot:IDg22595t1